MSWPPLVSPFDAALRLAVGDVLAHYTPFAIIAAGSVLRGQGGPTSDIDLYVLHHAPYRQRLQRRYEGVPFEIFINPPQQVHRYFEDEHAAARPITAHILTTGFVVLDRDPVVEALRTEAAVWLAKPPAPSEDVLLWRRYLIADELDNARDIVDTDAACASLILGSAVSHLVEYAFLAHNQHLPRQKESLSALDALDPVAAATARAFYAAVDVDRRMNLATTLATQLTGAITFFEWDSAQLPV
ncbi:MAG TPA: nucleotidyltransferase domain-containing protein [Caldilinea sp.]|nr:nucleotidyltransferase domain-containing protein [Anaerolineales bacterium]HRA65060.1 nucleotidyltransferase domain-containing protein [Caldilinea sp.]